VWERLRRPHLWRRPADAPLHLCRYRGLRVWPCLAQLPLSGLLCPTAEAWRRWARRVAWQRWPAPAARRRCEAPAGAEEQSFAARAVAVREDADLAHPNWDAAGRVDPDWARFGQGEPAGLVQSRLRRPVARSERDAAPMAAAKHLRPDSFPGRAPGWPKDRRNLPGELEARVWPLEAEMPGQREAAGLWLQLHLFAAELP
jgi:hypothetical protein